jgi:hypothetical protein
MCVKGRMDDAFPLGDQNLVVFVEESIEKKTRVNDFIAVRWLAYMRTING